MTNAEIDEALAGCFALDPSDVDGSAPFDFVERVRRSPLSFEEAVRGLSARCRPFQMRLVNQPCGVCWECGLAKQLPTAKDSLVQEPVAST